MGQCFSTPKQHYITRQVETCEAYTCTMLHIAYALPEVSTHMIANTFDLLSGNSVAEVTKIQHEQSMEFYIKLYNTCGLRQSRLLDKINNDHAKVYYTHDNICHIWIVTK